MNGYRCIACADIQTADFAGFTCPSCGNNLDISYDYTAIAPEVARGFGENAAGIFRYAALLPVSDVGGGFPLPQNPSASIKDRATAVVLQRGVDIGATAVSVASTGNAGSSTACLAAALGLQAIVFVPESAPEAKLTQALSYGATVLAVRGSYDDAFDLCLKASDEFGWFNRSTGYNPFTREGKKTCAYEIWEGLGRIPDRIVVPTGDGNLLSGIWKGWRDLQAIGLIDRLPKIDCAQSDASAAICDTVRRIRKEANAEPDWSSIRMERVTATTVADSISVDRPRDGLAAVQGIIQSGGEAVKLPDDEILAAIAEMARMSGVFAEPAAAAPWAAVKQLARDGMINADELIVCVVSGSGLKDIAGAQSTAGEPLLVDASIDAVRQALQ